LADRKGSGSTNGRPKAADAVRRAAVQLAELTGRRPENVLGVQRADDGWTVTLELLELQRVPNSTDLMGCYVVSLDGDGDLVGYERTRRYARAQPEDQR